MDVEEVKMRKFVTGDSQRIVVKSARKQAEIPCDGCGKPVTITVPFVGDVTCPSCSKTTSYCLRQTDAGGEKTP
jgi:hypothetical protein